MAPRRRGAYSFQWSGVDTNCTPPGDGLLDDSRIQRITLNENALVESAGTCGGVAWDGNTSGAINDGTVQYDVNRDSVFSTLQDYDDWANFLLDWDGLSSLSARHVGVACENPAPMR